MAFVKKLRGGIVGVGKSAEKAGSQTEEFAESSDHLDQSLNRTDGRLAGLRTSYLKVAAAAAAVVAVFSKLVRIVGEWIKLSNIQQRAETKLQTTLRNLVGATEAQVQALKDQASALQDVTGYGDEATISAQAMLATFKLTAEEIGQLTPRLLDMAESARKAGQAEAGLEQISVALGKAFSDGLGSLKRYGVALTKAQEAAFKLASQQDKVAILTRVLDGNFRGLAAAVGATYEGALRKAEAAQGDFGETLGDQLTKNREWLSLQTLIKESWQQLSAGITGSSAEISAAVSALAGVINVSFGAIRSVWNTAQIAFKSLVLVINEGINLINQGMAKITFGDVSKDFERAADELMAKNRELRDSIGQDVAEAVEAGRAMLNAFDKAGEGIDGAKAKVDALNSGLGETAKAAHLAGENLYELGDGAKSFAGSAEILSKALESLGVDVEEVNTGLKKTSRDLITNFTAIATSVELSGDVILKAYQAAIAKTDDVRTLTELTRLMTVAVREGSASAEHATEAHLSLGNEIGRVTGKFTTYTKAMALVKRVTAEVAEELNSATGALADLSKVNTFHELTNIASELQKLHRAGKITADELSRSIGHIQARLAEMAKTAHEEVTDVRKAFKDGEKAADDLKDSVRGVNDELEGMGDRARAGVDALGEPKQYTDRLASALHQVGVAAGLTGDILDRFVADNLDAMWYAWKIGGGKVEALLKQLQREAEALAKASSDPFNPVQPPGAPSSPYAPPADPGLRAEAGAQPPGATAVDLDAWLDKWGHLFDGLGDRLVGKLDENAAAAERSASRPVVAVLDEQQAALVLDKQFSRLESLRR